jgi:glycosyltransferase involved in cell wall biosynthesis
MEDGFGPDEAPRQFARRIWARKLLLRRATTVVPSLTLYSIARDLWRLPERRITHVANGVDLQRFRIDADPDLLDSLGISKTLPLIGAVATLRPEKNLGRLIDAFATLRRERPAQLVIVGDGPDRANLHAQAAEHGIGGDVVFTGFCAVPEKLLPAFSVVAVSSDTEQMPLSVLEAMAAGRPVAATGVGDIRYMLAEENHPFVVEKSALQLACAMLRLIDDPLRAANIGAANARRAAELFDQRRMFSAYRALFDQRGTGAAAQPQQLAN